MKDKKPRKPCPIYWPGNTPVIYVVDGVRFVMPSRIISDLRMAKRLHIWLGRYIAWREWKERR